MCVILKWNDPLIAPFGYEHNSGAVFNKLCSHSFSIQNTETRLWSVQVNKDKLINTLIHTSSSCHVTSCQHSTWQIATPSILSDHCSIWGCSHWIQDHRKVSFPICITAVLLYLQQITTVCFCKKVWDKMSDYIQNCLIISTTKKLEIAAPQQQWNKIILNFISKP